MQIIRQHQFQKVELAVRHPDMSRDELESLTGC
jgi:seryl-tRNA synthetase